jgi:multisubunit Na+/H+ antiporter MnhG subunit
VATLSWRAVVALILLIAGGLVELVAVLGLCVMRDVYDRLHYVGLASFGALLIGGSILVRESFSLIGDKALLVGIILVVTGPVLVQTTARSLLIRDLGDWRHKLTELEPGRGSEEGEVS